MATRDEKWINKTRDHYRKLIGRLDPFEDGKIADIPDEVFQNTPDRAAKAFDFLTSGYEMTIEDAVGTGIFDSENFDELILVKDIEFYSLCEHHMLPFFGKIHVGYIPNRKILGLSKIPRIVNMFARRLQVQERLTIEVADAIYNALSVEISPATSSSPVGVGVICEAQHLCMAMRGVQKQGSTTITNRMIGAFRDEASARAEFMSAVGLGS